MHTSTAVVSYASTMTSGVDDVPKEPRSGDDSGSSQASVLARPHLPQPKAQSPWPRIVGGAALTALIVGWMTWYANTPESLPVDKRDVQATGVTGKPLYIGMFSVPDGFDRAIKMSGIKVKVDASAKVKVTPRLCRSGNVGVTTSPAQFCKRVIDPAGQALGSGDSILLEVTAEQAALIKVDRIKVGFREGLRWGTSPAGRSGATISIVPTGR